jgi:transposase
MIKSAGIEALKKHGFYHITAITKPQINTMLNNGAIQLSLFDETLNEITDKNGERFILRRNPIRAKEIDESRESKLETLRKLIVTKNGYLQEHKRAKVNKALQEVIKKAEKLKIAEWLAITNNEREISFIIDDQQLRGKKQLEGCYIIKTDLPKSIAKETIHERYKDLTLVEQAFRASKTVLLDLRPIYVRLASRTRGHAFVVMLAYQIIKELSKRWKDLDLTVEEGIANLATLCAMEVKINERTYNQIPTPNNLLQQLFKTANVTVPEVLPKTSLGKSKVATRKKLPTERKKF